MRNQRVLFIVEVSLFAALGIVFSLPYLSIPLWLQGGSISLAMLPILFMAFRWGLKGGLVTGLMVGIINSFINPYIVHPVQYILDYPLAYSVVGLAGIFSIHVQRALRSENRKKFIFYVTLGTFIGSMGRLISHFIGGVVFFGSFAPEGMAVWYYSLTYNAGYIIPSFVISAIVLSFILYSRPQLIRSTKQNERHAA
ncbi:energy-coupled thiamine transporter ThiT [Pontibacillus litoralis]|uniref:Thiamine transporter ThiT n=1 Tax=Pontibacillus litoralis JSM 072002 TaxID=1385512 RepID=A0A0A5FZB0_9BACI|nr:energy-coupled thiamine transporter ThiT [Pontibacillus litoralis]KGX85134.1 hypothetical protein N784_10125 [Pontibacillus litoralis JSM 072002]